MPARFSYSNTTLQVRSVVPDISFVSPVDTPLLSVISGGNNPNDGAERDTLFNNLSKECNATKYEWMEVSDPAWSTTLGAGIAGAGDASFTAADPTIFVEGHIVQFASGEFAVVGATTGANPVPLANRGYNSTAAAQTNGTAVNIVGRTHREGGIYPADSILYPSGQFNYVQEMAASITSTDIEQQIAYYGVDDVVEFETKNKMRQLLIGLNKQLYLDTRVQGANGVPGGMGGMRTFVPAANVSNAAAAALTPTRVGDVLQTIFTSAGRSKMPDFLICNAWIRRKLTAIYASVLGSIGSATLQTFRDQSDRVAGVIVDVINTDFGPMNIVLDQHCPADQLWFVKRDELGLGPMRNLELTREPIARTTTSDVFMISGSYTFEMRSSRSHGLIYGLSTSS